MKTIISILIFAISIVGHSVWAAADSATAAVPRFSLLTCGVGNEVYLLEGHSALRVVTPDGRDMAVNWGMFDFSDPGFAMKFAKGETDYWVASEPTAWFVSQYSHSGRSVEERQLNLTDEQALALYHLITENLRPENAVYRYRYLTDNCATRPLALIENAITQTGGAMSFPDETEPTTWRKELRRYHRDHPLYQLFIDIALGSGIDRPISARERAFAPLYLTELIGNTNVVQSDGRVVPLSSPGTRILAVGTEGIGGSEPTPWWVIAPLAAAATAAAIYEIRRRKIVKWFNALIFFVFGAIGIMVFFLMFISTQEATENNINILWLNPLCLVVPLLVWWRRTRGAVTLWMWINLAALTVFLIGQPFFRQSPGIAVIAISTIDLVLTVAYIYAAGGFIRPANMLRNAKTKNNG